jgi:hypothetical protein
MRARIAAAFDRFVDIASMSDSDAARRGGSKGTPPRRDRTPTASPSPATSRPWSPDRLSGTDRSRDAALRPSTGERDSRDARAKKHPGAQLRGGGGDRIAQLHPADHYRGVLYDFAIRAQPNDGLQIRFFRPGAEDGAELEVRRAGGIGKGYLVARPVADRSVCPGLLPKSANEDVPEDKLEPGGSILNAPLGPRALLLEELQDPRQVASRNLSGLAAEINCGLGRGHSDRAARQLFGGFPNLVPPSHIPIELAAGASRLRGPVVSEFRELALPGPPQITCVSNKRLLPNVISGPPYACAGQGVRGADCVCNGRTNSTSRSELGWAFARTLKLGSLNALPRGAETAAH